ncbi:MAG: TPM domain-containing protein [Candidatus Liptonbacteria bacterium]|nr:TPM domain-containing protein [Candidatus Liptonbacteria bacterium]
MRRKATVILAAAALAVLATLEISLGATFPAKAPGMVTDAANIIPPDKEAAIEQAVRDYERKTSIEIAVVTVKSLEGLAVEDYAQELGTKWGVGKRGRDNGVLLLLAVAERKIRIHTGYGIEPDLTDAAAGRVIKEKMAPLLKKGSEDWGAGLAAGVQGIITGLGEQPYGARLEERNKPKQESGAKPAPDVGSALIVLLIVLGVVVIASIIAVSAGSSSTSSHSSRRSSGSSRSSSRSSRRSRDDDDGGTLTGIVIGSLLSGGGSSSSGSSSSGSDSGGGFSFGGGGFGGGGASGDF